MTDTAEALEVFGIDVDLLMYFEEDAEEEEEEVEVVMGVWQQCEDAPEYADFC